MLYLILGAVAAAAVFAAVKYARGRRVRGMAAMAEAAGLRLEDFGPDPKLLEGTALPFFLDGRAGIGRLLLEVPQEDGAKARYFDYSCLLGSGQGQRRKQATLALFEFEKGAFPDFHLSAAGEPEELSGLEPAAMAELPGFPEGARLYGRDQAALKKYFNPEIAGCFCAHPGWSAQGAGRWLVLYRGLDLASPSRYRDFMAEALSLAYNLA